MHPQPLFPQHKPYENYVYVYDSYIFHDETNIDVIPTSIQCKKFMRCTYRPEGYVDIYDIFDSLTRYECLNDNSGMEQYSISVIGENKYCVDLPVWEERFF